MERIPLECVDHDWKQISSETIITVTVETGLGGMGIPGDMAISIFRCNRCKVLKSFSCK